MRVLTVRQPWAWAIVHGGKDIENRTRNLAGTYRGPVAIHAGRELDHGYDQHLIGGAVGRLARSTRAGLEHVAQFGGDVRTPGNEITERFGNRGAVIGVVDLVGVHRDVDCRAVGPLDDDDPRYCTPWAMPGHHHLVLANPRPLRRPIPATGRLGLWRPDGDLHAAITAQLEETTA